MSAYLSLIRRRRDGRLFEAGRLLTFSTFRMDAYSRWALIRGCALIRINKVYKELTKLKSGTLVYILIINNLLETINLKPVERSSQIFLTLTVVNSLMSRVTWYDPNDQCASCFTLDGTFLLVSIGNSMICSDIWHKYHEWYLKMLFVISRAVRRVKFETILKYH